SDHTGGAASVLGAQPQARLLSSLDAAHELLAGQASQRCEAGQRWTWDDVQFEVLHPRAEDYGRVRRSNALSCVLRISNGTRTALLAGDIEKEQETRLLADEAALRADWLLVPHHGSKTSSTADFLDAVAPHWALVQAGYRNRYGHPATEVLARYTERDIKLLDSARCGAARWTSVQADRVGCERTEQRRYWQHRPPG
ncbi:MAG: competence protein ComEC, partial [Burkholderiaceae bacterium]|nr:competence protein ComEC [Burkholderiaceae bacterium]